MTFNPYRESKSLAIAVFVNQSGSDTLDMVEVTRRFYIELQRIEGLEVMPVQRVVQEMYSQGIDVVDTPEKAVALASELGVDGMIVGAITEYDPYNPPRVGVIIQLYASRSRLETGQDTSSQTRDTSGMNPGEIVRKGQPFEMVGDESVKPVQMVVRIFDADKLEVIKRLKSYARSRAGAEKPLSWERYKTSREYLGFVAHESICELLAKEWDRLFVPTTVDSEEERMRR